MPLVIDLTPAPPALVTNSPPPVLPALLEDLPPFEQNSTDIQTILKVLANELGRVEQARRDLVTNYYPRSSVALLHFFEKLLRLPTDAPLVTVASRQAAVLAFMLQLKSRGSGLEWEAGITQLVGTWTYAEHDPANGSSPPSYTVLIKLPYSGPTTAPAGLTATAGAAGGTLPAGTYYYAVSTTTAFGETMVSTPVAVTTASVQQVNLAWTARPAPATGYRVYRGASASTLQLLASQTAVTYTDTGAAGGAAPMSVDSSASIQAGTAQRLARTSTPAHLTLTVGYNAGFLIGISSIGIEPL